MAENFPVRPSERESPWFEKREAWDQDVENRIKVLEDTVDEGPTEWGQVVRSENVEKVVVTENADYQAAPGELVLIKPTPQWYFDFRETPRDSVPLYISKVWGNSAILVKQNNYITGGVVLNINTKKSITSFAMTPVNLQHLVSSSDPDGPYINNRDIEMVYSWRSAGLQRDMPRALFSFSGTETSTRSSTELYVDSNDRRAVAFRVDGSLNVYNYPVEDNYIFRPNTWYVTRVRQEGDFLKQKIWRMTQQEPDDWDFVHEGNPRRWAGGRVGFLPYTPGEDVSVDIGFVGVSIWGGRAPTSGEVIQNSALKVQL